MRQDTCAKRDVQGLPKWCRDNAEEIQKGVQSSLRNLNYALQNAPEAVIAMLPISYRCARKAVRAKFREHVSWLQSKDVKGGPIFGKVTLPQSVEDAVVEYVIPLPETEPSLYMEINDPDELEP